MTTLQMVLDFLKRKRDEFTDKKDFVTASKLSMTIMELERILQ